MPIELHDGGFIKLRKIDAAFDPTDRAAAFSRVMASQADDEILTGLFYIDESQPDMHARKKIDTRPLNQIPYAVLNPGPQKLKDLQAAFR